MAKPLIVGATAATVAAGLGTYVWQQEHRSPLLEIYIIALKNGQATFIRTPEDKRILINGGSNSEIIRHISAILPFYSRRIDTLIATDTAGKNVSGLIDVLRRYTVDRVLIPGVTVESLGLASSTDPIFKTFLAEAKKLNISLDMLNAGADINLDKKVTAHTLFPVTGDQFNYSKASAPEVILQVEYGATSAVFLGTASKKIQTFITPQVTGAQVLVVAQSGAGDNLSSELFDALLPEYFIYSKAVSYAVPKSTKDSKKKINPAEGLAENKRINLREAEIVKIVSDGRTVEVR